MRQGKEKKALIILGNGPSREKINKKQYEMYDTFELNYSIRLFLRSEELPTFYGAFDSLVADKIRKEINYLLKKENIKTKMIFASSETQGLINTKGRLTKCTYKEQGYDRKRGTFIKLPYEYSGANAAHIGIIMGYTELLLTGIDCRYKSSINTEESNEEGAAIRLSNNSARTSNNNNYWNEEYHREGDYIRKTEASNKQYMEWLDIKEKAEGRVNIYNISRGSGLNIFSYKEL